MPDREGRDTLLDAMRHRRVSRTFAEKPVAVDDLRQIVRAARWAPAAGNRRIHRFLVIRDRRTVDRLKPFAPGILGRPPALIVVSTDLDRVRKANIQFDRDVACWIDVGTALMSMMLAVDVLGLGSCPDTSFSQAAIARVLEFPNSLVPELILQIGYPVNTLRKRHPAGALPTAAELTDWERLGQREPAPETSSSSWTRETPSPSTIQPTR
jgi:nitroreductase